MKVNYYRLLLVALMGLVQGAHEEKVTKHNHHQDLRVYDGAAVTPQVPMLLPPLSSPPDADLMVFGTKPGSKPKNTSYLGRVFESYKTCQNTSMKEFCCGEAEITQFMTHGDPYDLSCIVPGKSPRGACLAGFYNKSGMTSQAPAGFFSPARLSCLLTCLNGAHCHEKNELRVVNRSLPWSGLPECSLLGYCCGQDTLPLVAHFSDNKTDFICPGVGEETPCPQGKFCRNTSTIEECPAGYFCKMGTVIPEKCPLESWCPAGSSTDITNLTGVTILVVFAFLVLGCVQFYEYRRRLAIKRRKECMDVYHYEDELSIQSEDQRLLLNDMPRRTSNESFNMSCEMYELEVELCNVSLAVPQKNGEDPLVVLNEVNATFRPGEVTAVMGPSGAGKTSVLSVLMGQAGYGKVSGDIRFNGLVRPVHDYQTITGYVPQDDIMHSQLTVREALMYQGELRLPKTWSHQQIKSKVDQTLDHLAITDVADTIIGDGERRGISGGQRKRVNIGMEIVAKPRLLVLDEPTSGLDASASLQIVQLLRNIASDESLTVIAVVHQPRFEVFQSFDQLVLLSRGGTVAYSGPVPEAEPYFQNVLKFPVPYNCNPADYLLDAVSGVIPCQQESVGKQVNSRMFKEAWKHYKHQQDDTADTLSCSSVGVQEMHIEVDKMAPRRNVPSGFRQLAVFFRRECVLHVRSVKTLMTDIFLVVLGAAFLGAANANFDIEHAMSLYVLNTLVVGLTTMTASLRIFGTYHAIFKREAGAGINRFSYFMAATVAHLPILLCYSVVYVVVLYSLLTPRTNYIDFYIVVAGGVWATSGLGYLVSNLFSSRSAQMAVVVLALTSAMLSGQSPRLSVIHEIKVVGPIMTTMSFARWMCQPMFEKEVDSYPTVFWRLIVNTTNYYSFTLGSKYLYCVMMLCAFGLVTRIFSLFLMIFSTSTKKTRK